MGYTTDFEGQLTLSQPLTVPQFRYLEKLHETRRMKRDVAKLMELYKGKHGYPGTSPQTNTPEEIYGLDGEFFVGGGEFGQGKDNSIIDNNTPPGQIGYNEGNMEWNERYKENERRSENGECQPGLWLRWEVVNDEEDENKMYLQWDGGEKFYSYIEWLKYLINKFFQPWGIMLNGEIEWFGEENTDMGKIIVKDNVVKVRVAKIEFEDED